MLAGVIMKCEFWLSSINNYEVTIYVRSFISFWDNYVNINFNFSSYAMELSVKMKK